eukprot:jgi/Mesen1/9113/ME000058S08600
MASSTLQLVLNTAHVCGHASTLNGRKPLAEVQCRVVFTNKGSRSGFLLLSKGKPSFRQLRKKVADKLRATCCCNVYVAHILAKGRGEMNPSQSNTCRQNHTALDTDKTYAEARSPSSASLQNDCQQQPSSQVTTDMSYSLGSKLGVVVLALILSSPFAVASGQALAASQLDTLHQISHIASRDNNNVHVSPSSSPPSPSLWSIADPDTELNDLELAGSSRLGKRAAVIDTARILPPLKLENLERRLKELEAETGWQVRVLTRLGNGASPSGAALRRYWQPNERTIIVIENVADRNVLNFNTGDAIREKLPRQFFVELQSRFGNQFYVAQEGDVEALLSTTNALCVCLAKPDGCRNVPGLVDDLYYLTLATSIAGGAVFGFGARVPPSGRVSASWQWVLIFSPLWVILFCFFGILPIVGRTEEWTPIAQNTGAFLASAAGLYLTPILGQSPIYRGDQIKTQEDEDS